MFKGVAPLVTGAVAVALLPVVGLASGTDNASSAAYSGGNYAGQNGGTGFGAFTVTTSGGGFAGTFVGSAAGSEGGTGTPAPSTINTGGQSFGFYSNGATDAQVTITRPFTTGLSNTGDSFSLDLVPGYNDAPGFQTVGVGGAGTFRYDGSQGGFSFNGNLIQGFTSGALHLTYTVTAPNTYSFSTTGAFNYTSSNNAFTGALNTLTIVDRDAGNGGDHNGYFNNLAITNVAPAPEPGGLVPMLLGTALLGGVIVARRRRGQTA